MVAAVFSLFTLHSSLFTFHSSLLIGWLLDLLFGDPARLPHPIVWFGKMIAFGEHRLNKGSHRKLKGALMALFLIVLVFAGTSLLISSFSLLIPHFSFQRC